MDNKRLDRILELGSELRSGGPAPEDLQSLSDALSEVMDIVAGYIEEPLVGDSGLPAPMGMRWRMADGQLIALFGSADMDAGLQHYGMPGMRLYDDDQMAAIERQARHWRKNHDHVVAESRKKRAYPAELTDNLRKILGLMLWNTGSIAHLLRDDGADIPRKAEDEQAHALHWLTNLALQHPDDWHDRANKHLGAIASGKKKP